MACFWSDCSSSRFNPPCKVMCKMNYDLCKSYYRCRLYSLNILQRVTHIYHRAKAIEIKRGEKLRVVGLLSNRSCECCAVQNRRILLKIGNVLANFSSILRKNKKTTTYGPNDLRSSSLSLLRAVGIEHGAGATTSFA